MWIRVTNDPETWPTPGVDVLFSEAIGRGVCIGKLLPECDDETGDDAFRWHTGDAWIMRRPIAWMRLPEHVASALEAGTP